MKKPLLLVPFLLSACTSVETLRPDIAARVPPSRLDEIAYINALREAFDFQASPEGCYNGARLEHFRPTLEQGYRQHDSEQESATGAPCVTYREAEPARVERYLEAGFGLTDLYCQRFFIIAQESAQKRRFQRSTGTTVGGLVNSVLGLANAGETAISIAGAGFTALNSGFQNVDDAFLVAPELETIRTLVHAAQDDYRQRAFANPPTSYLSARAVIERYAGHCSYPGMKQLVEGSLASETAELERKTAGAQGGTTGGGSGGGSANGAANETPQPDASVPVPVVPRQD